ncbi:RNA polymerase sigma-70 factor (ECF subfamily) [Roseivirga pacifica]|uniref:RNA polymerase sigma-70 factor, ECF subfamily n=1 Tax=Roseivirga pacifica TaxID=1267423 RepID=A0A1I0ND22_9BACT|nr:RNA polymerase sigma factor [Roseivirga pacifica]MCO6359622.1 sigma-70 family RNA polymerase sigma factor [Roseivirga pacifica]MCO6366992.1 sigma-70 family RNA polymerase sigma factor [Roseivirga pacifica]MCO6370476.1 sigma-70 family RNA polymerase sigma factor [Roseivirga pacifica]MCO6374649.1 sigma-70 family RNA polymerase sigma factor [Roseivirga pacifica]MCO6379907.1 sigma-70 family RNA polymerase sigma factor [Roseivirga pacifica]
MKGHNESYAMELIIAKVKQGDMVAFNALIDEYKAMAFTLSLRLLKNREDAEEATQDAFVKAYKNIGQFEGKSKFSTWLYTIVYHTALTQMRKRKLETTDISNELIENSGAFSESGKEWQRLQRVERSNYIQQALDRLLEDDQVAITLFYLNENSLAEISEITGWEMSNVKVRLHRARKRLLGALEQLLDDEVKSLL